MGSAQRTFFAHLNAVRQEILLVWVELVHVAVVAQRRVQRYRDGRLRF